MVAIYICAALSVALSFIIVYLENHNVLAVKYALKAVASLCFVLTGIFAVINADVFQPWQMLVLIALILGMLGDIFLSSNNVVPEGKALDTLNLSGLLFFLVGHIIYIVWLLQYAKSFNYYLLFIVAAVPLIMFLLVRLKVLNPGKATIPCLAYAAIIGLMLASAINFYLDIGAFEISKLVLSGGVLFCVSDSCLAYFNFGGGKNPLLKYVYMPTYYVAQCLFALAILF